MKKLLFIAALGVAGLVSAKNVEEIKTEKAKEKAPVEKTISVEKKSTAKKPYNWVTIVSPCGAVFYLDMNDYATTDAFWADAHHFSDVKCN